MVYLDYDTTKLMKKYIKKRNRKTWVQKLTLKTN
jgi:hypothetical protein